MKLRADPDYLEGVDSLQKPIVVISFEDDTSLHCVDILEIPGQGFGFREFRRDPEVSTTNRLVFSWLRWADPEETVATIDKFYETWDIRIFAPNHTNVIHKDLPRYMESLREAMRTAITGNFHLVY